MSIIKICTAIELFSASCYEPGGYFFDVIYL